MRLAAMVVQCLPAIFADESLSVGNIDCRYFISFQFFVE